MKNMFRNRAQRLGHNAQLQKQETPRKLVVAHFMVGNTYPYTIQDWLEDIRLAHTHHIDGFALNFGREDWQQDRIRDCYAAALQTGLEFTLFPSFDMTSIPAERSEDVALIRNYVTRYSQHPNQMLYNGKMFVSTFAGETSLFGQRDLEGAWAFVKASVAHIAPLHMVPSFFIDPARYPSLPSMDGYFNWNGSWPLHLTPESPREEVHCPRLDTDRHHVHCLGGRTFMAAVSPWFFTHYGQDSWNKNWIYRGDDWLYVRRWEQLVASRSEVDIVQTISWNDYGESHYIGLIKGAQPNSQAWVDGYPHEPWLDLTAYFARAFKNGTYPDIEHDRIYMWARPHLKNAEAPEDSVARPDNWKLTDDSFWVVVFAIASVTVEITESDTQPPTFHHISEGVTKLSGRMLGGGCMKVRMLRHRIVVAQCPTDGGAFYFQIEPRVYNFNVIVMSS